MPFLNRDSILNADDIPQELVNVPEWGGDVYVRGLTARDLDKYQMSMLQQRGKSQVANLDNIRAKLVVRTAFDENGARIFTDDDAPALSAKSGAAVGRLFEVAQRLSGLGKDDIADMTKELEENPLGGSPSD